MALLYTQFKQIFTVNFRVLTLPTCHRKCNSSILELIQCSDLCIEFSPLEIF